MLDRRAVSLVILLGIAGGASADDKTDEKPRTAGQVSIGLPSFFGISGLRNMVDARTPSSTLQLRGLIGYEFAHETQEDRIEQETTMTNAAAVTVSASAFTFLELGGHVPFYVVKEREVRVYGLTTDRERSTHTLTVDIGLKAGRTLDFISAKLDWLAIAPYLLFHVSRLDGVQRLDGFLVAELGCAVAVTLLEDRLSFHADLAFAHLGIHEDGFRLRFGVFGVPVGWPDDFVLRVGAYLDYLTAGSGRGDSIEANFGVQSLVLSHLIIQVTGGYRVFRSHGANDLSDRDTGELEVNVGGRIDF
jgi:hypothetical protein